MFVRLAPLRLRAKHWGWRDKPNGERNIVPKIIITDTINSLLNCNQQFFEISNHNSSRVLFDKIASCILFEKHIYISALEMASPGNRHCANCIGTLSFRVKTAQIPSSVCIFGVLVELEKLRAVLVTKIGALSDGRTDGTILSRKRALAAVPRYHGRINR